MRGARLPGVVLLAIALWLAGAARAEAQLGNLISPGRLARPHAELEGLANCQKCHEQGRKVVADKCLSCHKSVADRIARQIGVHRAVKGDCVSCHVEHAGLDGELRPFDTKSFDHAKAGFALDGKHARVAADCAACHKTRSFLTAQTSCAACHTDVHKGSLGKNCESCHSARTAFKELGGQFDHARAAFQLKGAHQTVPCARCHVNQFFKGVKFAACTDCHQDPHRQAFGATCTACHTNETWRTKKVDHARTTFKLVGRHVPVDCAACHKQPAMKVKPKANTCATCHADVHRGAFRQDCKACHSESGFSKAPFDHTKTRFALTGKHEPLACEACHKNAGSGSDRALGTRQPGGRGATPAAPRPVAARTVVDFRGLNTTCMSCHRDVHGGELGGSCESCHSSSTFRLANYVHPRAAEFFAGQHAPVACVKCHKGEAPATPVRTAVAPTNVSFKSATTTCASCHEDAHFGQEGTSCESCHSVQTAKFAVAAFAHEKTAFQLTGKHQTLACALCHKRETGAFPAKSGTAVRFKGLGATCAACHADVHLGQVANTCEACHATSTFKLSRYKHQSAAFVASGFFRGRHSTPGCQSCHKPATGTFPAGKGTAIKFKVDSSCVSCHVDVHRGALGSRCIDCHRL